MLSMLSVVNFAFFVEQLHVKVWFNNLSKLSYKTWCYYALNFILNIKRLQICIIVVVFR